jgi:hypothetical protein
MNGEKRKFTNMCAHLGARRKAVVLLPALMETGIVSTFHVSHKNHYLSLFQEVAV